jgi:hypothetical protein
MVIERLIQTIQITHSRNGRLRNKARIIKNKIIQQAKHANRSLNPLVIRQP